jgi:hypothetical protein
LFLAHEHGQDEDRTEKAVWNAYDSPLPASRRPGLAPPTECRGSRFALAERVFLRHSCLTGFRAWPEPTDSTATSETRREDPQGIVKAVHKSSKAFHSQAAKRGPPGEAGRWCSVPRGAGLMPEPDNER